MRCLRRCCLRKSNSTVWRFNWPRQKLACFWSHRHNPAGDNVAYSYSYLFGYAVALEPGGKSIKLPDNPKIRILAMTVAEENPSIKPAQPLYDVLPPAAAGDKDFLLSS